MSNANGKLAPHKPAPAVSEERIQLNKPGLWTVRVTPDIAFEWLTKNYKENRRVRPAQVKYLADEMRSGRWQDDHPEAILFDEDGEMIEGQHRCHAVVESEKTVRMRVETGVRKSLYPYLDSGLVRTLEDRIHLDGSGAKNKVMVMLITWLHRHAIGKKSDTRRVSPEVAYELFKKHKESITWAANAHRAIRGVGRMSVLAACMEFYEIDKDKAALFAKTLYSVDGQGDVGQARTLRDAILRKFAPGKIVVGGDNKTLYHMAVSAMKAYMENRHPSRIIAAEW